MFSNRRSDVNYGKASKSFTLRPSEIRYSQETISSAFSNGTPLTSTFSRLISGKEKVTDLPAIKCISRNGRWYSGPRGNRRLFLYKKLEEAGFLTTIDVLEYHNGRDDFTISTGSGLSVRCLDSSMESEINEIISKWKRSGGGLDSSGSTTKSSWRSQESEYDQYNDYYSHGSSWDEDRYQGSD